MPPITETWQQIPNAIIERQKREADAKAFADKERAHISEIWGQMQRAKADALIKKYMPGYGGSSGVPLGPGNLPAQTSSGLPRGPQDVARDYPGTVTPTPEPSVLDRVRSVGGQVAGALPGMAAQAGLSVARGMPVVGPAIAGYEQMNSPLAQGVQAAANVPNQIVQAGLSSVMQQPGLQSPLDVLPGAGLAARGISRVAQSIPSSGDNPVAKTVSFLRNIPQGLETGAQPYNTAVEQTSGQIGQGAKALTGSSAVGKTVAFLSQMAGQSVTDPTMQIGGGHAGPQVAAKLAEVAPTVERAGAGLLADVATGAKRLATEQSGELRLPGGAPQEAAAAVPAPMPQVKAALRGTEEQAAMLRAPEEGFAGNIRLEKFPEGVRPLIEQAIGANNEMAGARRGVISDPEALKNATTKALGTTVEQWVKSKPGRAYTQEEALALGQTLSRVGDDYAALAERVGTARTAGQATPQLEASLAEQALTFATLAGVRAGAAAEAGRALRSFRQALTGENASRTQAIQAAFKQLGGGEQFSKWAEEFGKIPVEDTVGRYKMLESLYKPTLWDKLSTWRYASMLSGYKTHMVNALSNTGESMARPLETAVAGYPRAALADVTGMVEAIPEGIAAFKQTLSTGATREQMGKVENIRPRAFGDSPLGRAITAPLDLMSAADEFFQSINYAGALRSAATRLAKNDRVAVEKMLANPTPELVAQAERLAHFATFTNEPGPVASWLMQGRRLPGPAGLAIQFVIPFIRTPANVFQRGAAMTGRALVVPGLIEAGVKAAKGQGYEARIALAKTALASLFGAGFAALAVQGRLSGDGPRSSNQRNALIASGWQPHSIKIGDRWIDYTNLGPVAVPMAVVAAGWEGYRDGEKPLHNIHDDVISRIARILADTSYVKSIGDLFSMTQGNAVDAGSSFLASAVNSLVPAGSLLATGERVIDPTVRSTDTMPEAVAGRLPGVSRLVPPQIDLYGAPKTQGTNDQAAQAALPLRSSAERGDPVADEVARLIQAGHPVDVRQFGDTYAGAPQTPDQRRGLQTTMGETAKRYIADVMSRPDYANLDDAAKAATLNKALNTAYAQGDLTAGENVARSPEKQADLAWAEVPHYRGVTGSPDEIRQQNFAIANAKRQLTEYRTRYGEKRGEHMLRSENPDVWRLAQSEPLNKRFLASQRAQIEDQYGPITSDAEPLVGAGSVVGSSP